MSVTESDILAGLNYKIIYTSTTNCHSCIHNYRLLQYHFIHNQTNGSMEQVDDKNTRVLSTGTGRRPLIAATILNYQSCVSVQGKMNTSRKCNTPTLSTVECIRQHQGNYVYMTDILLKMSKWNVKQIADAFVLIQVEIIILLTRRRTQPQQR